MPTPCQTYVQIVQEIDSCNGSTTDARCVLDSSIYSELSLSENSSQQEINQAQYLAIINQKAIIDNLNTQIDLLQSEINIIERPYKVYSALLTQGETNAPTAIVLENTLGDTVVWTRVSTGIYDANLIGAFILDKVFFVGESSEDGAVVVGNEFSLDYFRIKTFGLNEGLGDDRLNNTSIEIRVYN